MSRPKKRPAAEPPSILPFVRRPLGPALASLRARFLAAVAAARTWDEFAAVQAEIARCLSPAEIERAGLWDACERKRLAFDGGREWDKSGPTLF
jgi:hypothetical protein